MIMSLIVRFTTRRACHRGSARIAGAYASATVRARESPRRGPARSARHEAGGLSRPSRWPRGGRDPGCGQAGQVGADLPEPYRSGLVVAALGGLSGLGAARLEGLADLQS